MIYTLATVCFAHAASSFDELQIKFLEEKQKIHAAERDYQKSLYSGYARAVKNLQIALQNNGDLENALKAKEEIELSRELKSGTDDFPGIAELRTKLSDALAQKSATSLESLTRLQDSYLEILTGNRENFTKGGQLEQAIAFDSEIKNIEQGIAKRKASDPSQAIPGTDSAPPAPELTVTVVDQYISNSTLKGDTLTGEIDVEAGKHRLTDRVSLGDRAVPKGKKAKAGIVKVPTGSTIVESKDTKPVGPTDLTVTLYHNGLKFAAPGKYGRTSFVVADGRNLTPAPGSTLKYRIDSRELEFE